ncbi:MAG: response regulator transcription factor, partial [Cyanobacteria bacterium P01_E01_bin.35]
KLLLYFAIYSAAITLTEKPQPDVILMDIQMPICDGVTATAKIHESYPWIKILMLTTFADAEYIGQSLQAGAKAYLLQRKSPEEMEMAIRTVNRGYAQLSLEIASKVFAQVKSTSPENRRYLDTLISRELEVLRLVGKGKSNHEIASILNLSIGKVKNYIT